MATGRCSTQIRGDLCESIAVPEVEVRHSLIRSTILKRLLLVLPALMGCASASAYQNPNLKWPIYENARIRVTSPWLFKRETGVAGKPANDSLIFFPDDFTVGRTVIPARQITRLEASTGMERRVGTGALLGFLIVGGGSAAITAATWNNHSASLDFGRWGDAALIGGILGAGGALVGAIAGINWRHEGWEPVPLPPR